MRANTTFAAYNGQQAVISGGAAVGGWTANSNGVWTAHVPLGDVQQLTVNGTAQQMARYPDYNPADPIRGGWAWAKALPAGYDDTTHLAFGKSVFTAGQLSAGETVVLIPDNGYGAQVMTIASVDYAAGILTFKEQTDGGIDLGARFYVQGAKALLGNAGEWWFDKTTQTLSFLPPTGFSGTG